MCPQAREQGYYPEKLWTRSPVPHREF